MAIFFCSILAFHFGWLFLISMFHFFQIFTIHLCIYSSWQLVLKHTLCICMFTMTLIKIWIWPLLIDMVWTLKFHIIVIYATAVTNLAAIDYRSVYIESLPSLHAKTLLKYREFSIYDVCVVGATWSSSIVLKIMTGVNTLQIYHM